jgi:tRNA(Ile)-lysidine synthase
MSDDNTSIGADELEGLFGPLAGAIGGACALAVSGGSDSTALMVLFADWLRQTGADPRAHTVLTIDHGLRAESPAEARAVADRATTLGFRHAVLVWDGPKPQTGIQAAAREARYRLMGGRMAEDGVAALLVAHTRDDQAETLLMRLARGSGLDGLSAMAPWAEMTISPGTDTMLIVRPLLGMPKARLRLTLERRGIGWIEDPSNWSSTFERTRWRAAREALDALGLSDEMLAGSVRRLQRARAALEGATDDFCSERAGAVSTDPLGFFRIDRERLRRAPEEIALRVVDRCITAAGGLREPVSLSRLEPLVSSLRLDVGGGSWTLARAQVTAGADVVRVEREPGRLPLPVIRLAPGPARAMWDGRFVVEIAADLEGNAEVRALGEDGLSELKRARHAVKRTPALLLTAAIWRDGVLLAVPPTGFWAREGLDRLIAMRFVGVRYNSSLVGEIAQARKGIR